MSHACGAPDEQHRLLPLQAALDAYAQHIQPLPTASRPLLQALDQVLAAEVFAGTDLPLFTQSAVDGYALRSGDGTGPLRLVGEIPAGLRWSGTLGPGEAVRIFTGGALPDGADTVARQEIVRRESGQVWLQAPLAPGADTRYRGEELREGARLALPGQRLHAGLVAAVAMAAVNQVQVRPRPRVAVLVTGNEVLRPGETLSEGRIHDANGPLVQAWLAERGYPLAQLAYVADTLEAVTAALEQAAATADLVISTGGVSVGDYDYLPQAAQSIGYQQVFWKVAQKPGKPIWYGMRGNQPLLALPGNPGAVLIGLEVHVQRALDLLEGLSNPAPRWRYGQLAAPFRCDRQRDSLVRVEVSYSEDGRLRLQGLPKQDSHMLSNLARANALAWLPAREQPLPADSLVPWLPLHPDR